MNGRVWLVLSLCVMTSVVEAAKRSVVDLHGPLSFHQTQLVDQHGEAVCLAGPSFFWSNTGWEGAPFYRAQTVDYFVDDWQVSWVRAAVGVDGEGGLLQDASNEERATKIIERAIERGIYVLVDFHSHHAEDHEALAIDFFSRMAKKYGHQPNLIYEIYNEPLDKTDWASTIKPYAAKVIAAIRAIDPDNLIIVGTQSWSQEVDKAADDPFVGFHNIAYSLHFYAGTHHESLRKKALYALAKGLPIVVTEWGSVEASGDGEVATEQTLYWFGLMEKYQLSHANWSVSDKKEGASIFKSGSNQKTRWTDADLTRSGLMVKTLIKAMSEKNAANGSIARCKPAHVSN